MKRNALALMLISTLLFLWIVGGILLDTTRANFGPVPEDRTIYIRSDGNVEPSTAAINRNGNTYILTEDIASNEMDYRYSIEIQKDNIVLDGSGHTLQGVFASSLTTVGVTLKSRNNVTVKNINAQGYTVGFIISNCSNCIISENNINPYESGIQIQDSNQNIITKNIISNYQYTGILLSNSNNNVLVGNNIRLDDNYPYEGVVSHGVGFPSAELFNSSCNIIAGNNLTNNDTLMRIKFSSSNMIYHNNFASSRGSVEIYADHLTYLDPQIPSVNNWDNGWGGNYWSDYKGIDNDADGIGDMPYTVDIGHIDRFPLTNPYDISKVAQALLINPVSTLFSVSILTPKNNTYISGNFSLKFEISKPSSLMGYSLDGQRAVKIPGNISIAGLSSGLHNITVYAKDVFENIRASETIIFSIEEPFPTVPVVAASAAIVAVASAGLVVYFKKRKR